MGRGFESRIRWPSSPTAACSWPARRGSSASDWTRDLREADRSVVLEGLTTGGHSTRTVAVLPERAVAPLGRVDLQRMRRSRSAARGDQPRAVRGWLEPGLHDRPPERGGLWVDPATGRAWATNMGRDWLGDDQPPETVYEVVDGADAGWPSATPGISLIRSSAARAPATGWPSQRSRLELTPRHWRCWDRRTTWWWLSTAHGTGPTRWAMRSGGFHGTASPPATPSRSPPASCPKAPRTRSAAPPAWPLGRTEHSMYRTTRVATSTASPDGSVERTPRAYHPAVGIAEVRVARGASRGRTVGRGPGRAARHVTAGRATRVRRDGGRTLARQGSVTITISEPQRVVAMVADGEETFEVELASTAEGLLARCNCSIGYFRAPLPAQLRDRVRDLGSRLSPTVQACGHSAARDVRSWDDGARCSMRASVLPSPSAKNAIHSSMAVSRGRRCGGVRPSARPRGCRVPDTPPRCRQRRSREFEPGCHSSSSLRCR